MLEKDTTTMARKKRRLDWEYQGELMVSKIERQAERERRQTEIDIYLDI